jgi:HAMP domain-containing protein
MSATLASSGVPLAATVGLLLAALLALVVATVWLFRPTADTDPLAPTYTPPEPFHRLADE